MWGIRLRLCLDPSTTRPDAPECGAKIKSGRSGRDDKDGRTRTLALAAGVGFVQGFQELVGANYLAVQGAGD